MTTYVMLANWTEQGILKAKDSPRRLDAAKKALKDMSGEFKSFYLTMGDYDMVAIFEAPDDAVAARFSLQLGMQGNVRTRTLKSVSRSSLSGNHQLAGLAAHDAGSKGRVSAKWAAGFPLARERGKGYGLSARSLALHPDRI